jgi:hypothetical protein
MLGSSAVWQLSSVTVCEVPASGRIDSKTFNSGAVLDSNSNFCYIPALTIKQQLEWDAVEGHKLNSHLFSKTWDKRWFSVRGGSLCAAQFRCMLRALSHADFSDFIARTGWAFSSFARIPASSLNALSAFTSSKLLRHPK